MGIFCSVVEAFVRAMFDAGHDLALCRTVGAELIGDHDAGRTALSSQELRIKRFAALALRRLWTRTSRTKPS